MTPIWKQPGWQKWAWITVLAVYMVTGIFIWIGAFKW